MPRKKKTQEDKEKRGVRGEGSVYQRKSDGRWVASVSLGDGKKKQEYFDTEREAYQARRRMLLELEQRKLITGKDQTLENYLEYWLGIQQTALRETSYSTYYRYLHRYVIPALGSVKLQKLAGDMFQSLYAKMLDEGVSSSTVRLTHAILKKALGDAVKWKKLPFNPVKDATPPRFERREMQVMNKEQAKTLLKVAEGTKWSCLLVVALLGMREGELLGLKWGDIDFEKAELKVQRSLSYFFDPKISKYRFKEGPPKSEAGKRTIHLPHFMIKSLKLHYDKQVEERSQSSSWESKDLVFCTMYGGYIEPMYLLQVFKRLLRQAGLPEMRFHDIRHSAATILLEMGVNAKVIQELLGHEDVSITLGVYGHVLKTMHQEAVNHLDEIFGDEQKE